MKIKADVSTANVTPAIWYAVGVLEALYYKHGQSLVVTSLTDGKHSESSLHYVGKAVDVRTKDVNHFTLDQIVAEVKQLMRPLGFDVVQEADHLHVEFDPKPGREEWTIRLSHA